MIELLGGGVIGSLLGGLFRLAPEVLKWLDRKNERSHELQMFDRQCKLEAQRGEQKLAEIGAQREAAVDSGVLAAFRSAIDQQSKMVEAAGGWAARLSASVRPVATYYVLLIWGTAQLGLAFTSYQVGVPVHEVFRSVLTVDFMALVSGTLNYWFLDRTLARRGI